jgi:hypothetical protein
MYTPVESQVVQTSQVEVPTMSYGMTPETQVAPQVSYTQGPLEVLPPIYLPSQSSQIATPAPEVTQVVVPQVEQTVSMVPQVSQIAVSQVAPVVPTIPVIPVAVSQVAPTVPMAPPMPKPLTPSPPYEAFVPPTPVTKNSLVGNPSPQVYQFYQAVPVPPPAPVTTTSFVNVPVTTSVNVPVTTTMTVPVTSSMTVPVSSSMNVANPYSTFTAPAPVAPSSSLLLETPQYQTATAASYM